MKTHSTSINTKISIIGPFKVSYLNSSVVFCDLGVKTFTVKCPLNKNLMDLNIFRLSANTPNVYVKPKREQYIRNPIQQKIQHFKRFIENYRRHIVCFIVVYGISAGVALERCYCE